MYICVLHFVARFQTIMIYEFPHRHSCKSCTIPVHKIAIKTKGIDSSLHFDFIVYFYELKPLQAMWRRRQYEEKRAN